MNPDIARYRGFTVYILKIKINFIAMIIYKRKKKQLTIPCGLGPVVCPDVSHDLQMKTVDSSTVLQQVNPDSGYYGLSSVIVEPYTLESKAQTITLNGTYSFTPSRADGLSSVDISVNVADIPAIVQNKTVIFKDNGEYTVTPDQGYDGLSSVDISVNVPDIPAVLQEKTVNSSTERQSVTYDNGYDGLSSVTVEPYILDSKTVNSSTAQQVITSSVDGLSSVTIEPYVLDSKTVNSSTAQQVITSDKDGLSSVTVEPYTLDSKTVDPSTSQQVITSSVDGLSSVTVNAVTSSIDPDIQAGNIKRGVEILGVTGIFDGGSLQSKEVNSSTNSQSVTPDSGYYGLSGVTVKPYTLDSKTVNSSTAQQVITSDVDGLSSVTVEPYTLESKAQTITLNGTYSFTPTSADGLSSVDISVNVADIPAVVQSKSVTYTENGEYTVTPDQGYEGLSSVDISVNIPPEPVVLQSKTVKSSTESQSVTYDSGYDGLSSVTVEPYILDSKTVNSSTAQQVITSSVDGLSSVTVEPYTVESDSSTLTANGTYTFTPTNADALSSVTVDVSVNTGGGTDWIEEVRLGNITDISSYSIAELAKKQYGAAGLFMYSNITSIPRIQDPEDSSITDINNIDNHSLRQTFFGCNSLQNVDISVGCIGMYGMYQCFSQSSVRDVSINVNELDGYGAYTFAECFNSSPYLRNLYINLGPGAQTVGQNTFNKMCYSVCIGSSENFNTTITIEGLKQVYSNAFKEAFSDMHTNNSGGITVNLPDNLVLNGSSGTDQAFYGICQNSRLTGKTTPSFLGKLDYINGVSNCFYAFKNTDVETATLGFNTCTGGNNFSNMFYNCYSLRTVTFDGSFNVSGNNNFLSTFIGCSSLTSMTCTSTAGTKPFRDNGNNNVASSARGITDVTIDNVNSDVYLRWNPNVNAASVYGILSKAVGATVQQGDARKIEFYSPGLTVTDYEDGRIQAAYDAAVADGWTINNLTILPYSQA